MTFIAYFCSLLLALFIAAVGELVSDEIRARLDRIPLALLSAAAKRLSQEQRVDLYECAWLPELHYILRGEQAMPITRLIHGIRFALRLWLSAPRVMHELEPGRKPATLSRRMADLVLRPNHNVASNTIGLPFVAGVVAYSIHRPSSSSYVLVGLVVALMAAIAFFGSKSRIRRYGPPPSKEMFCQCRFSTICRSLAVITNLVGTVVAGMLAFQIDLRSNFALVYVLAILGCGIIPGELLKRGFVLRPTESD